jgi:hypothetical protein
MTALGLLLASLVVPQSVMQDTLAGPSMPGAAVEGVARGHFEPVPVSPMLLPDSGPRPKAIEYSDAYYTRLMIHRYASYAVLPLFVVEYVAGEKLLQQGSRAPLWAEKVHKPAAIALGGLFLVNTVTGVWNLVESRNDPTGRSRRTVHAIMMLAADAGFAVAAQLAPSTRKIDARIASGTVGGWTPHKTVAVASIGVATIGDVMMWLWKD